MIRSDGLQILPCSAACTRQSFGFYGPSEDTSEVDFRSLNFLQKTAPQTWQRTATNHYSSPLANMAAADFLVNF